jgi:hypothetical protein
VIGHLRKPRIRPATRPILARTARRHRSWRRNSGHHDARLGVATAGRRRRAPPALSSPRARERRGKRIVLAEAHDMSSGRVLDQIIGVAKAARQWRDIDAARPAPAGRGCGLRRSRAHPRLAEIDKVSWMAQSCPPACRRRKGEPVGADAGIDIPPHRRACAGFDPASAPADRKIPFACADTFQTCGQASFGAAQPSFSHGSLSQSRRQSRARKLRFVNVKLWLSLRFCPIG